MINAGAIATATQVWHHDPERAEALTLEFVSALAGRRLEVDQAMYGSKRASSHRNRAISHLLRNAAVSEEVPEPGLDLDFRQCAIRVTSRDLAVMAATLAWQGRNPLTQAEPLNPLITTRMLAVMGNCNRDDFAGQWLYDVGMPAKSGVGGGGLAVVPGRLGIAVDSPRLNAYGNSVRGAGGGSRRQTGPLRPAAHPDRGSLRATGDAGNWIHDGQHPISCHPCHQQQRRPHSGASEARQLLDHHLRLPDEQGGFRTDGRHPRGHGLHPGQRRAHGRPGALQHLHHPR
jgi:hypothetical protein